VAGVQPTPRSTAARRAASDRRKQAVGQMRISTWLSAASIEALDALVATWGLGGRTQGVEIAIRHLADRLGRGVIRLRHRS
jgi:hypothetical protein